MPNILFVCTANQFRSPIAAACFSQKIEELKWKTPWMVGSAGTWTLPGNPALPVAVAVGHRLGISIIDHKTRSITPEMVSIQDLILVMEKSQRESLQAEFPIFAGRVFLLAEVAVGSQEDVADPVLGTDGDYWGCALQVKNMVEKGFYRICAKAMRSGVMGLRFAVV